VIEGKTKNAKRTLVMLERVAEVLKRRHKEAAHRQKDGCSPAMKRTAR